MIDKLNIEGEKNKELKQKLNEVIEVLNRYTVHTDKNNTDIAWLFANASSILKQVAPPSPTSPHSGESLNGLVSSNRFTVQTASNESKDPSILEHDDEEEDDTPPGTVLQELDNDYVLVKGYRGSYRMKKADLEQ